MNFSELKNFLDEKSDYYNCQTFLEQDPLQIPHRFSHKQDIEISGFLTAVIAWGNRKSIISAAEKMLDYLDHAPHEFVLNFQQSDVAQIKNTAVHRTFSGDDLVCFLNNLQKIYQNHDSMEELFLPEEDESDFYHAIERFRNSFFCADTLERSSKHISSTYKNSSAKRLMMFLRWMVRNDGRNVDFGIWNSISPSKLSIPLDVHTGNISRKLGLVNRTQNDWKTVQELDAVIRKMDPYDPAKYDFALFGLGVSGELS